MEEKFIKAVSDKNLIRVRLCISNELLLDPRGNSFTSMLQYAEAHLVDLYQEDDGKRYETNTNVWNDDFLISLKNDLDLNFSREKISLYEQVAKLVLKNKAEQMTREETISNCRKTIDKGGRKSQSDASKNKKLYTCITVGGVAVAVTGLCISRIALASLGFAGVFIGGILLYNDVKK